jgi:hypothetical protein
VSATDAIVTQVPAAAQELETHLRSRRHAVSALVSLDGEDRWGYPGPERLAQMQEEAAELNERIRVAEAAMTEQVTRLRESDPTALEAWISAQELLLESYIHDLSQHADQDRVRTEIFVARDELKSWSKVRVGELAFVDQNSFYVHLPSETYVRYFGFEP